MFYKIRVIISIVVFVACLVMKINSVRSSVKARPVMKYQERVELEQRFNAKKASIKKWFYAKAISLKNLTTSKSDLQRKEPINK